MPPPLGKPCAIPECVSLRTKDSYLCAVHQADADNKRRFTMTPASGPIFTSKYGAIPTMVGDIRFDSTREAEHYQELLLLEKAGVIRDLELQPEFALIITDEHGTETTVGHYRGDFRFFDVERDGYRVQDVKGFDNRLSQLKRKIVKARYGIDVEIVS